MRSTVRASSIDQPVIRTNSRFRRRTRESGSYIVIITGIRSMMVWSREISPSLGQARDATTRVMRAMVDMNPWSTSSAWRGGSGENGPEARSVPYTAMAASRRSTGAGSRQAERIPGERAPPEPAPDYRGERDDDSEQRGQLDQVGAPRLALAAPVLPVG